MTFRKFDTATWTDPWFEDLSPRAKLAFIYFWTNETCNPAGIYDLSDKRIKFHLGYGIDTIYSEIDTKILWDEGKNTVWVKNFFKRQCQNFKFAISALNSIKDDQYKLSLFVEYNRELLESFKNKNGEQIIDLKSYHTDTIPIPYPTDKIREEAEKKQRREDKPLSSSGDEVDGVDFIFTKKKRRLNGKRWESFKLFWDAFDHKKGKREAADAWYDIPTLTDKLVEQILKAAKIEAQGRPDKIRKNKTPIMAQGWISGCRWEDEEPATGQQEGRTYKKL